MQPFRGIWVTGCESGKTLARQLPFIVYHVHWAVPHPAPLSPLSSCRQYSSASPFQTEMLTVCCCILPDTWHRSFPHWHFCATVLRTQIFCSFLIFSVRLCMLRFGLAVLPCRSSPKPLREWQPLLSSSSLMRIIISLPHNTFQCSTNYSSVAGTCFQEQIL